MPVAIRTATEAGEIPHCYQRAKTPKPKATEVFLTKSGYVKKNSKTNIVVIQCSRKLILKRSTQVLRYGGSQIELLHKNELSQTGLE